jgi:hypothetical protein
MPSALRCHLDRPLVLLRPLFLLEGLTRAAAPMAFHGPRLEGDILSIPLERLVLVPSKYEPEDIFLHRPQWNRCLSLVQMDEAA